MKPSKALALKRSEIRETASRFRVANPNHSASFREKVLTGAEAV